MTRTKVVMAATLVVASACSVSKRKESAGDTRKTWAPESVATVQDVPFDSVRATIERQLSGARPKQLDADRWAHVRKLYAFYTGGPLWLGEHGLDSTRAGALVKAIVDAGDDGLPIDRYAVDTLSRTLAELKSARAPTSELLASVDLLLTYSFAALGEDLLTGQLDPRKLSQDWHIDARDERVDSALVRSLRSVPLDSAIDRMRPQEDDYRALRSELVRYRVLASRGEWPLVPSGRARKPGESDAPDRLAALRSRLDAERDPSDSTPPPDSSSPPPSAKRPGSAPGSVYDRMLAGGVARFQARHGIVVDSILGKETVDALNVPVSFRLGQIATNLERYRWLPRTLGTRYVIVNVPAFRLEAINDGKTELSMKVIVGTDFEGRKTPVFSDSMETVVFRPFWLVTDSIATKEVWPKANADPTYLERNNYETYKENGQTRVRQKPGAKNSLGLVKFLFPNSYNVYLHDTPEGELFKKDVRAFSHGCIRLEKPAELANWVLGWPDEQVHAAMENGPDNKSVKLPTKIPVYIAYFTTYVRDGQLYFGNDLYKRDDVLVPLLAGGTMPNATASSEVAALRRSMPTIVQ